jgi:hypothetical protein
MPIKPGGRGEMAIVVVQRVVVGLRNVDHAPVRIRPLIGNLQRNGRARFLQVRIIGIADCDVEMFGFDNLAIHELESETDLRGLAIDLHDDQSTDLLRHRIGGYDLELGWRRLGRLPQAVADLDARDVFDHFRITREGQLARVVCDQCGQIGVGQLEQRGAVQRGIGGLAGPHQ